MKLVLKNQIAEFEALGAPDIPIKFLIVGVFPSILII